MVGFMNWTALRYFVYGIKKKTIGFFFSFSKHKSLFVLFNLGSVEPFILYDSVYWIVDSAKEQCKFYRMQTCVLERAIHMQPVLWLHRLFSVFVLCIAHSRIDKIYNECAVCCMLVVINQMNYFDLCFNQY